MPELPNDIEAKIHSLFYGSIEREEVKQLLMGLWKISLNVGEAQLARSILVISNGKLSEIKKIIDSNFYGDPRDVIMLAEQKTGNPGHYFINGFD